MDDSTTTDQAVAPQENPTTPTPTAEGLAASPTDIAPHKHHGLVHGTVVVIESLVRQLEEAVADDCHEAIDYLRKAIYGLKDKLESLYKSA